MENFLLLAVALLLAVRNGFLPDAEVGAGWTSLRGYSNETAGVALRHA